MSDALAHFLEQALPAHLEDFDRWFPAVFDWRRLCADVPTMAEHEGHRGTLDARDLERAAEAVFQAAHLLALGVTAVAADPESDPTLLLDRLTAPPDDAEEELFAALVARHLGAIEERLGGELGPPDPDPDAAATVDRAVALVDAVWPATSHFLGEDESAVFDKAGAAAPTLWGLARVGAILAALRWIAAERGARAWPRLDLET